MVFGHIRMLSFRCLPLVVQSLAFTLTLSGDEQLRANDPPRKSVDFQRDVRPILSDKCLFCHGPDEKHREAQLRLDMRDGVLGAPNGKKIVVPSQLTQSELWKRITHADPDHKMPPADSGKSLSDRELGVLRQWIEQGADWKEHWAYSVPVKHPIPAVKDDTWPRGPLDRFLLARLDQERLAPSPDADPHVLARRLAFDLTGLPPTVEQTEHFVNQFVREQDNAIRDFVAKLVSSPSHAERMALYWLDLVRYADTVGYHGDQEHHISPYRDYVIQSFLENKPFDRFTREQLAGDLLASQNAKSADPASEADVAEWKIASGYNRLLQTSHEGGVQQKEYLAKYSADRVRNVATVWLGATIGCAECHDHKFDPLTQRDFYRLAACFADLDDVRSFKGADSSPTKREPELDVTTKLVPGEKRRTMISVSVAPRPIRVLARGDWLDDSGEVVAAGVPSVFRQIESPETVTRLDLANWLTSRDNPLTARVFVNRLWKQFFGKGLSGRLDDFGAQGEPPVHPELLDWLAVEFMESGWNVRHMVTLMVTSRVYRQSSAESASLKERDPDNRLLARQSRWRLEAEFVRDNALAVSGLLNRKLGGASARPYQPAEYYQFLNFPKRGYKSDTDDNQYRRGMYVHWQRAYLHPMLKAFDAPCREECTTERPQSSTPLSSLVLLNDPTFVESARVFATRALREGGITTEERIRWMWQQALNRPPTIKELAAVKSLLDAEQIHFGAYPTEVDKLLKTGLAPVLADVNRPEVAAWTSAARAIFNLVEFNSRN